jgi:hypothetical protein
MVLFPPAPFRPAPPPPLIFTNFTCRLGPPHRYHAPRTPRYSASARASDMWLPPLPPPSCWLMVFFPRCNTRFMVLFTCHCIPAFSSTSPFFLQISRIIFSSCSSPLRLHSCLWHESECPLMPPGPSSTLLHLIFRNR